MPRAKRSKQRGTVEPRGELYLAYYTRHGIRWRHPGFFGSVELAEAWLRDEYSLIDRGEWTPPTERATRQEADATTFGEYALRWIGARRKNGQPLKRSTRTMYAGYLRNHCSELADLPLVEITRDVCDDWYETLCPGHDTERAHVYAWVRSVLASAHDAGLIDAVPLKVRGAGRTDGDRTNLELPTPAQVQQLADAMAPEHRLAVLLAAWCGLRFGEIAGLQRGDFTMPRDRPAILHVRRGVVTDEANHCQRFDTTKTPGSVRDVPIPEFLVPDVRKHLRTFTQPGKTGLLFPGESEGPDGYLITPGQLKGAPGGTSNRKDRSRPVVKKPTRFFKAAADIGMPWLHFHDLRAFYGTNLRVLGATERATMRAMGHRTQEAAMRYQHAGEDYLTELGKRLSDWHDAQEEASRPDSVVTDDRDALEAQLKAIQARLDALDRK
ncbi:tyrosine-type recombinase/integrase [Acidipropionibacterium acidipropionici]|uniref:tyrosine-type recombinase/integrase n=1 Tax=Acidipropionibacterium acidipropionici TaxID=1748 RepID=UPI00110AEF04|nr:site-specific integrase [Acidipropionibacterium acidipropionici]QCV94321.1 site-specific integrase [Acidipropionibacterium acidipropionici]